MSDAAAPAAAIEVRGVSKAFASPGSGLFSAGGPPVVALRDVELTIARGEALGIAGPNGAGKTRCSSWSRR